MEEGGEAEVVVEALVAGVVEAEVAGVVEAEVLVGVARDRGRRLEQQAMYHSPGQDRTPRIAHNHPPSLSLFRQIWTYPALLRPTEPTSQL